MIRVLGGFGGTFQAHVSKGLRKTATAVKTVSKTASENRRWRALIPETGLGEGCLQRTRAAQSNRDKPASVH